MVSLLQGLAGDGTRKYLDGDVTQLPSERDI